MVSAIIILRLLFRPMPFPYIILIETVYVQYS